MPFTLQNPLTIVGANGVTASNSGIEWDGSSTMIQQLTIGQDVSITSDVQFGQITASSYRFGNNLSIGSDGRFHNNLTNTGDTTITTNLSVSGYATVNGKITAEIITTELSSSNTIFKSGSTQFGNSLDDTHYVTGSLYETGSFILNGYSTNEISNDVTLNDNSQTAFVTEKAAKTYGDSNIGTTIVEPYLRKNFNKNASTISNNTASFNGALSASAPEGITATNETDFIFFNNGQVMEHDALTIQQSGGTFYLITDSDSIGYNLTSDDEIKSWGRFEPTGYLDFDGTDDEVTTTFSGSSGQGTNVPVPKTYSFWAKSSETARNQSPFGWGTNKKAFTFNFHAGRVLRWYNSNWYIYWDDTSAQDDGKWHHWMVYDSPSELLGSKLYVDGTLIPINEIISSSEAGASNYNQPLTIGSYRNDGLAAGAHFSGSIKEFSVFPGDKTSNASKYYNNGTPYDVSNEDELQAYWKISESSGSIAYDYSGNGNNGTLDGATWNS